MAKAKHRGVPLLESKSLNVLVPTIKDLANSLPSAWKRDTCDRSGNSGGCHPSQRWLDDFWTLVSRNMSAVPAELHSFVLVPITGNRLARPGFWFQGSKFVVPSELCYDLEEDTHHGYQVPSMPLRLLNKQPAVKQ
ncbi:hypothetical protein WJX82_003470 [Trebouxia sp. C0006]